MVTAGIGEAKIIVAVTITETGTGTIIGAAGGKAIAEHPADTMQTVGQEAGAAGAASGGKMNRHTGVILLVVATNAENEILESGPVEVRRIRISDPEVPLLPKSATILALRRPPPLAHSAMGSGWEAAYSGAVAKGCPTTEAMVRTKTQT